MSARRWLVAGLAAVVTPAFAADWRADYRPLPPGAFPPPRPQSAEYRFGWGVIPAAEARIDFTRTPADELQLRLTARSIGAVRKLWQFDAEYTGTAIAATLRPTELVQIEKYRNETEKTVAQFTAEQVEREQETQPPPKTPTRRKRLKFPLLNDLHSALLLIRSQRLEPGDRYSLVVYPARTAYLARVEVVGREMLKLPARNGQAVKLRISLQHLTKQMELEPHKKFKNASAWLSDDRDRLLLKIEAEVFVGKVWMEMQSVKFTGD